MGFWSGASVLVTGAGGFVGSHVVERLLEEGASVTAAVRREPAPFLDGVRGSVRVVAGDLESAAHCERAVAGQRVVLHLAGHVGGVEYNRRHHATLFHRNLLPLLNVLDAARRAGAERFLVVSSACVYPGDAPAPIREEEGTRGSPEPTNAGYGWAKRMQEYLGAECAREFGMSVAIVRPFNAYGPRDDFRPETSHVIPALIVRALEGDGPLVVWGSGEQSRAFLYVKDLARGLLLAAERHACADPVNLGPEGEVTIRELVQAILQAAGRAREVVFDASRPEGQRRRACDTAKMRQVLGWRAETPLPDGLRETIAWYRSRRPAVP